MLLNELPTDILECILLFLDGRAELYITCLICRSLSSIAQPRLYENLHNFKSFPKSRRLEDAEVRIAVTRACRTLQHRPPLARGVRSLQLDFTEKLFQKPDRDVLMPSYTRLVCKLLPRMTGLRYLRVISSADEDFHNLLTCEFRLRKLAIEGSLGPTGLLFLRQQSAVEDAELYCDIDAALPADVLLLPHLTRFHGTWTNAAAFVPHRPVQSFAWSGNRSNLETIQAAQPDCLALSTGPIQRLLLVSTQLTAENLPAILRSVQHVVDISLYVLWRDCNEIMTMLNSHSTRSALAHLRSLEKISIDGRRMQQVSSVTARKFVTAAGEACPSLCRVEMKGFRKGDPFNWDTCYVRMPGGLWQVGEWK